MNKRRGFTLIELLVVVAIIALLMAILMPTLTRVRRQAKSAADQVSLRQWGLCFSMYADDNDGSFPEGNPSGKDPSKMWIYILHPYYRDGKLRMCPMATRPWGGGSGPKEGDQLSAFVAWGPLWGDDAYPTTDADDPWDKDFPPQKYGITYSEEDNYSSYIQNDWVRNDPRPGSKWNNAWRTSSVKGAGRVPLMTDGKQHYVCLPSSGQEAPQYEGEPGTYKNGPFKLICINRHDGFINGVFLDWSARSIGLRELWKLKWSRHFDTTLPPAGGWPNWLKRHRSYD